MKNLKRQLHFLVKSIITSLLFIPLFGYAGAGTDAGAVRMPCCNDSTCPTVKATRGEPYVVKYATFEGVAVPISTGEIKVVTIFAGNPRHDTWENWVDQKFSPADAAKLKEVARTKHEVKAWCAPNLAATSEETAFTLTPGGPSFSCQGPLHLFFKGYDLKCLPGIVDSQEPFGVIGITKDDKKKRELEALRAQYAELERQRQESAKKIEQYDSRIDELGRQIFGLPSNGQSSDRRNVSPMYYDMEQSWENGIESEVRGIDFSVLGTGLVLPDSGLDNLVSGTVF